MNILFSTICNIIKERIEVLMSCGAQTLIVAVLFGIRSMESIKTEGNRCRIKVNQTKLS